MTNNGEKVENLLQSAAEIDTAMEEEYGNNGDLKNLVAAAIEMQDRSQQQLLQHGEVMKGILARLSRVRLPMPTLSPIMRHPKPEFDLEAQITALPLAKYQDQETGLDQLSQETISYFPGKRVSFPDFHTRSSRNCAPQCSCRCHKILRLRTPNSWSMLLGSLLIAVSRQNMREQLGICNEISCQASPRLALKMYYRFPSWLLYRLITLTIMMSPLDGPELLLRTQRIINPEALIFRYSRQGKTEEIKQLLASGQASVLDISADDGVSALVVSRV
jgi:flavodoxin